MMDFQAVRAGGRAGEAKDRENGSQCERYG